MDGRQDRRQCIDAFDDILVLANGGGERLGIGEADDAGDGETDQDADRVPQKLVEDRPVSDADGDNDEGRHQSVNRHMPEKAGRDEIACLRLCRLHGVADHVAVDDDAVTIHEPGSGRRGEDQEDHKRLDDIFGGKNDDERAEKGGHGNVKRDDGNRIGGKIGVNLRPECPVREKQQIGRRQQAERHAADLRTIRYCSRRFRGKKSHCQIHQISDRPAATKKGRERHCPSCRMGRSMADASFC
ncbi:hypothetical protein D3C71_803630 [compost metagenome]